MVGTQAQASVLTQVPSIPTGPLGGRNQELPPLSARGSPNAYSSSRQGRSNGGSWPQKDPGLSRQAAGYSDHVTPHHSTGSGHGRRKVQVLPGLQASASPKSARLARQSSGLSNGSAHGSRYSTAGSVGSAAQSARRGLQQQQQGALEKERQSCPNPSSRYSRPWAQRQQASHLGNKSRSEKAFASEPEEESPGSALAQLIGSIGGHLVLQAAAPSAAEAGSHRSGSQSPVPIRSVRRAATLQAKKNPFFSSEGNSDQEDEDEEAEEYYSEWEERHDCRRQGHSSRNQSHEHSQSQSRSRNQSRNQSREQSREHSRDSRSHHSDHDLDDEPDRSPKSGRSGKKEAKYRHAKTDPLSRSSTFEAPVVVMVTEAEPEQASASLPPILVEEAPRVPSVEAPFQPMQGARTVEALPTTNGQTSPANSTGTGHQHIPSYPSQSDDSPSGAPFTATQTAPNSRSPSKKRMLDIAFGLQQRGSTTSSTDDFGQVGLHDGIESPTPDENVVSIKTSIGEFSLKLILKDERPKILEPPAWAVEASQQLLPLPSPAPSAPGLGSRRPSLQGSASDLAAQLQGSIPPTGMKRNNSNNSLGPMDMHRQRRPSLNASGLGIPAEGLSLPPGSAVGSRRPSAAPSVGSELPSAPQAPAAMTKRASYMSNHAVGSPVGGGDGSPGSNVSSRRPSLMVGAAHIVLSELPVNGSRRPSYNPLDTQTRRPSSNLAAAVIVDVLQQNRNPTTGGGNARRDLQGLMAAMMGDKKKLLACEASPAPQPVVETKPSPYLLGKDAALGKEDISSEDRLAEFPNADEVAMRVELTMAGAQGLELKEDVSANSPSSPEDGSNPEGDHADFEEEQNKARRQRVLFARLREAFDRYLVGCTTWFPHSICKALRHFGFRCCTPTHIASVAEHALHMHHEGLGFLAFLNIAKWYARLEFQELQKAFREETGSDDAGMELSKLDGFMRELGFGANGDQMKGIMEIAFPSGPPDQLNFPDFVFVLSVYRSVEGLAELPELEKARSAYEGSAASEGGGIAPRSLRSALLELFGQAAGPSIKMAFKVAPNPTEDSGTWVCSTNSLSEREFLVWARQVRELVMAKKWEAFRQADADGSGSIDMEELAEVLQRLGFTPLQSIIHDLCQEAGCHGDDDCLDFDEFITLMQVVQAREGFSKHERDTLEEAFDLFSVAAPDGQNGEDGDASSSSSEGSDRVLDFYGLLQILRWLGCNASVETLTELLKKEDMEQCEGLSQFFRVMRQYREQGLSTLREVNEKLEVLEAGEQLTMDSIMYELKQRNALDFEPSEEAFEPLLDPPLTFDGLITCVDAAREEVASEARKNAFWSTDEARVILEAYEKAAADDRGIKAEEELPWLLANLGTPMKNMEERTAALSCIPRALRFATAAGCDGVEEYMQDSRFMSMPILLHVLRIVSQLGERKQVKREREVIAETGFSAEEVSEFRAVFIGSASFEDDREEAMNGRRPTNNVRRSTKRGELEAAALNASNSSSGMLPMKSNKSEPSRHGSGHAQSKVLRPYFELRTMSKDTLAGLMARSMQTDVITQEAVIKQVDEIIGRAERVDFPAFLRVMQCVARAISNNP